MRWLLLLLLSASAAPHVPPVRNADLRALPPLPVVNVYRNMARANLERCQLYAAMHPDWRAADALDISKDCFMVWDTLHTALVNQGDERLDALHALRHLIGYTAYYSGTLPPPGPPYWIEDDLPPPNDYPSR